MSGGLDVLEAHDALLRGRIPPDGSLLLRCFHVPEGKPERWEAVRFLSASVSHEGEGRFVLSGTALSEVLAASGAPGDPDPDSNAPERIGAGRRIEIEYRRGLDYALVFFPCEDQRDGFIRFLASVLEGEGGADPSIASERARSAARFLFSGA